MPIGYGRRIAAAMTASCDRILPHPVGSHCLANKRANSRRMGTAPHCDDVDLPPELRIDNRPRHDTLVVDAEFRQKTEPHASRAHGQNPVVALAAIDSFPTDAVFLPGEPFVELAVDSIEVALVAQVLESDGVAFCEMMRRREHDHHALPKELQVVKPVVRVIGAAVDRDFEFVALETLLEFASSGIDDFEIEFRMTAPEIVDQNEKRRRR